MGNNIKQGRRCVIGAGRRISVRAIIFAWTLVFFSQTVSAQMTWGEEDAKRIRAAETVGPLSDSLMGDSVSLFNGGLSFPATDVSVPVIGGLFGQQKTLNNREEVLVLITPNIVRDANDLRKTSDEYGERFRALKPIAPMGLERMEQ